MATTSNPTLTSVAMAVRSAEKIISVLKDEIKTEVQGKLAVT
jgi:hypothetical protein